MIRLALFATLIASTAPHAFADITAESLPEACRPFLPVAQAEYAAIQTAVTNATIAPDQESQDTRRQAILRAVELWRAQPGVTEDLSRYLSVDPRTESTVFYDLRERLHGAFSNIRTEASSFMCTVETKTESYGDYSYTSVECSRSQPLPFPTVGRTDRTVVYLNSRSWEDNNLVLGTCDTLALDVLSVARVAGDSAHGVQLSQCLRYDLASQTFETANRVYVPVAGLMDGCFGTPSVEVNSFEDYFRHRMRFHQCWGSTSDFEVLEETDTPIL